MDILKLTGGAKAAAASKREVVAPGMSTKQQRFLAAQSSRFKADPLTGGLCLLPTY